jgi:signal transduction histidine kinase
MATDSSNLSGADAAGTGFPDRAELGGGGNAGSVEPLCARARRRWPRRRAGVAWRRLAVGLLLALAALGLFSVLIVGGEVATQRLWPNLSTGAHHALLTLRAGTLAVLACVAVYVMMRRQQKRLADTARQLMSLLKIHQENPSASDRFDNPRLVSCAEVFDCDETDCAMHAAAQKRCWQVMALRRANGRRTPVLELEQCLGCEVYRRSCPDSVTELGEAFNNLLFLLEAEASEADHMRDKMLQQEKMVALGQIAAGVAHEIGNPLSSISSIVQMLKRSRAEESTSEQLDLIDTHIQRITGIVRQMVRLARPSADNWERVDLAQTLGEAVRLVSFDRRARNAEIVFECPATLPSTYAVPDQLQQVFLNLALNGLDAMPTGGTLTIEAKERWGDVIVRVQDTGDGIEAAVGRRLFEPFFTTKQPGEGTGLGLAVSYGIIQKHGGTIEFSSTPGQGTEFTLVLPVLKEPPDAQHAQKHHSASRR